MSFDNPAVQKPKYVIPKMEDVEPGDWFTFTFNPTDRYQFFNENSLRRPHEFKKSMQLLFRQLLYPTCKYDVRMEVSPKSRLHLHGTIQINDVLAFYLDLHNLMGKGTIEISEIRDDGWDDYCIKQKNHWLPFDGRITSEDKVKTNSEILLSALDQ